MASFSISKQDLVPGCWGAARTPCSPPYLAPRAPGPPARAQFLRFLTKWPPHRRVPYQNACLIPCPSVHRQTRPLSLCLVPWAAQPSSRRAGTGRVQPEGGGHTSASCRP